MKHRQTSIPRRWLVADERFGSGLWQAVGRLPKGSGILLLFRNLPKPERARLSAKLRAIARRRGLVVADELAGEAARVHNVTEVRQAALAGVPLLFLSPICQTRSHPDWKPLPRMRAAALLRLAKVPVVALGGMDASRFRRVERLGFSGWAAIDAWSVSSLKSRDERPFQGT